MAWLKLITIRLLFRYFLGTGDTRPSPHQSSHFLARHASLLQLAEGGFKDPFPVADSALALLGSCFAFRFDNHHATLLIARVVGWAKADGIFFQELLSVRLRNCAFKRDNNLCPLFHELLLGLLNDVCVSVAHHSYKQIERENMTLVSICATITNQHVEQEDGDENHKDDEDRLG